MYSPTNEAAAEPEDTAHLYDAGIDLIRQFETVLGKLKKRQPQPPKQDDAEQQQRDQKPTEAPTNPRCSHGQQQTGSNASNLGLASHFGPLANQHRSDAALQPAVRMDPSELKLIIKLDTWMADNGSVIVRPSLVEDRARGDDALCSCNADNCLKDLRELKDLNDQKRRGKSDQAANNSSQRRLGVIQGQQPQQAQQQKQPSAAVVKQHRIDVSAKANVGNKRRSRTVAVIDSGLQPQQQQQRRNPRQPNRQPDVGRSTTAAVVVTAGTSGDNNDDDNNNAEDNLSSGSSSQSSSGSSLASGSASSADGGSSSARRRKRRNQGRRAGTGGVSSGGVDIRQLTAARVTPPTQIRGCRGCNQ